MKITIENLLTEADQKKLSATSIKNINESIAKEMASQVDKIETETKIRFDSMVESISSRFDNTVVGAITEGVSDVGNGINTKLVGVVTDMIGILENAGIHSTEKTKEIQAKLKVANQNVETAVKEREVVKDQLDGAEKENYILNRLVGTRPEIVSAALDFFKNKDILDVQDELDAFIDGDFSEIVDNDTDDFDEGLSDVTLDQVSDVLSEISKTNTETISRGSAKFESLGRGLNPQKGLVTRSAPDVTDSELHNSASLVESDGTQTDKSDAGSTLNQIEDFRDLGYNFNKG
jgi:hypothetical protein